MTAVFMVVFVVFRKTRVVWATSRELSAVILCGILLCYFLPLSYIGTPHVKLSRIHRIFNQEKFTVKLPYFIDWKSQLVFAAIIVSFHWHRVAHSGAPWNY